MRAFSTKILYIEGRNDVRFSVGFSQNDSHSNVLSSPFSCNTCSYQFCTYNIKIQGVWLKSY